MIQNQVPSHKDQDMITGNDVHDNSSSTGSEATPTASQGIAKLESRIKAAQVELDRIHVEAKDEDIDAALEAASKIENKIVTMRKHLDALVDKAATTKPRDISQKDIPRFQLDGQTKLFSNHESFSSLEHFLSEFEGVITLSNNDIELVWKRCIPMAIHFTYHTWMKNELLKCANWTAARASFFKHFGTRVNAVDLIAKLFRMRMRDTDTLRNYTNRFIKNVQEAGLPLTSNTLAKFYQSSLLQKNQQMMVNQMLVQKDAKHCWTINEIYECVLPLFLADEQSRPDPRSNDDTKGKRKATGPDSSRTKAPKVSSGFFCSRHGGNLANHNTADCRSNSTKKANFGSENKPFRATSGSNDSSAAANKICDHCKKPKGHGKHWCREYEEYMRATKRGDINVHMVKTGGNDAVSDAVDDSTDDSPIDDDITMEELDAQMAELDDEIDAEQASLNCKSKMKSKHESFNPFQLLTPIILERQDGTPVRLIAKVDTGSDSTLLNKDIFYNKLLFTSQDITVFLLKAI